ncbi:unnamed protein product [Schistosoma rodhaini]|nr:unnamed protein product [Schistosoma rodhaini]
MLNTVFYITLKKSLFICTNKCLSEYITYKKKKKKKTTLTISTEDRTLLPLYKRIKNLHNQEIQCLPLK